MWLNLKLCACIALIPRLLPGLGLKYHPMSHSYNMLQRTLFRLGLCTVLLGMAMGCATTQSAVKKDATFTAYEQVYLAAFEDDPRHVQDKVVRYLEDLGFTVIRADEDHPIWGSQGTGFIVSEDGYVLTAAHVIGTKKEATVWLDGKRYEADLISMGVDPAQYEKIKQDKQTPKRVKEVLEASVNSKDNRSIMSELDDKDIALLKIRNTEDVFAPVSFGEDVKYAMGQDVFTIGFPLSYILGVKPRLNKGLISSTVGIKDHPNFVQISVEVQPGNSGGPLLNDEGQVVGMVQMSLDTGSVYSKTGQTPQNVNFAVKSQSLLDYLNESDSGIPDIVLGKTIPFEEVQQSVVQIQAGLVPEGFRQETKLVCQINYSYFWDLWFRFNFVDVIFYDMDTNEVLLRAGQYGDNTFTTEDKTLDRIFKDIKTQMGR